MTKSYRGVNYGLEEESGLYFAYSGSPTTAYAQSGLSQEDALLKLSVVLTNKLESIRTTINRNMDNSG
jgi:hypothetical protein